VTSVACNAFREKPPGPSRYLLAIGLVALATAARFAVVAVDPGAAFAPFYVAVAAAFALAGAGPGVLALLAGAGAGVVLAGAGTPTLAAGVLFALSAAPIGAVVLGLRRQRDAAAQKSGELATSLSLAVEGARLGVWRFDPASKLISISASFAAHLGLPPDTAVLGPEDLLRRIHPEDRAATEAAFEAAVQDRTDFGIEHRVVWRDGVERWIHGFGRPVFSSAGALARVDGVTIDITDRKHVEQNFTASMATIRAAFMSANEAILIADTNGNIVDANDAVAAFCHLRDGEALPATYAGVVDLLEMWRLDGRPVTQWENPYLLALQGRRQTLELKFRRKDTGEEWYGVVGVGTIYGAGGKGIGAVVTAFDITELKALQGHLEERVRKRTGELAAANAALLALSRHDALTGLFNRLAANERLREEFQRMKRTGAAYAVLMLDIDFFKGVNDSCGHSVGDAVLAAVARTLSENLRFYDFVARWGGEEFLVLLPATDPVTAGRVAEQLRAAIEKVRHPPDVSVTVSIGAAGASPDDLDEDIAVRRADQALYEAKKAGRNRVVVEAAAA
jgi:diguanylate cyclase (GGDEF)-like protein/PAS domain S-box-containing protein